MKKFVFTLASLLKIKETQEKEMISKLAEIGLRIANIKERRKSTKNKIDEYSESYNNKVRNGVDIGSLMLYKDFFADANNILENCKLELQVANKEKQECQIQVMNLMNERKALEKLKEKQYLEYLLEEQRENEKEINDFISYNTSKARIDEESK